MICYTGSESPAARAIGGGTRFIARRNTMQVKQVGMTRAHYEPGNAGRIRMVVMHATAGTAPGDYGWLRQGGSDAYPVSVHYYIDKAGNLSQMVDDQNVAW